MKRMAVTTALLLAAGAAHAESGISVQVVLGTGAEAEVDKIKVKKGGSGEIKGDDEDLEKNLGVMATWDTPVGPRFRLGARAAYITAEGDDSEQELWTLDAGVWGRYLIPLKSAEIFIGGAVGPTMAKTEFDIPTQGGTIDAEFGGFGYHVVAGGGVSFAVSDGISLIGGLFYSYQAVPSMEAEGDVNGVDVELEMEEAVVTRFLLTAGVLF